MNIKELITNNTAKFVYYREGNFIYRVGELEFPVPLDDVGKATLLAEDKAIFFMRYIRKHLEVIGDLKQAND